MTAKARVRIDLGYDGAPFAGFARQPDQTTVQGTLEGALSRLLGSPTPTVCAGRTDRGVHALAQVVHLDVTDDHPRGPAFLADLADAADRLDQLVGDAITIWHLARAPAEFDARFSATERRYRYRLVDVPRADPRLRGLRWHLGWPLRLDPMRAAARHLCGEHDYASFCRRRPGRHTTRRIDELTIDRSGDEIHIVLRGPAFCHQQVRSIVGCLVAVGRGDRPPDWIAEVLAARDRALAAPVAPAHGLTLESVRYGDRYPPAPPATGHQPPG